MVDITPGNTPEFLILAHNFTKSLIYIMYLCMLAPDLEDIDKSNWLQLYPKTAA